MKDGETTILVLRQIVQDFVQERDWEQFHNPKDLAAAIAIEAAELQEHFLWKSSEEVLELASDTLSSGRFAEELADIIILCLSFANSTMIDISEAVSAKVAQNALKYPTDQSRGRADKYTRYQNPG